MAWTSAQVSGARSTSSALASWKVSGFGEAGGLGCSENHHPDREHCYIPVAIYCIKRVPGVRIHIYIYIYVHLYTHLITCSDEHKQNNGNYYHEQYYCCYGFCCCHRARTKSKPTSGPCVNRTPNCSKLRGRIFKKGTYNSDFNANPELTMVQRLKLEQWAPSTGA